MRITNIQNSIANVCRFSARVNQMLRAFGDSLHQWHLQPRVAPVSTGNSRTNILFGDLGMFGPDTGTGLSNCYLAITKPETEPTCDPSCETGGMVILKRLFQRLS